MGKMDMHNFALSQYFESAIAFDRIPAYCLGCIMAASAAQREEHFEDDEEYVDFDEDEDEELQDRGRQPADPQVVLQNIRDLQTDENKELWKREDFHAHVYKHYTTLLKINNWQRSDEEKLYDALEWFFGGYSGTTMEYVDSIKESGNRMSDDQLEMRVKFCNRAAERAYGTAR
jgi:hypothetical protein